MLKKSNLNVNYISALLFFALCSFNIIAQDRTITGVITAQSGDPLPGVTVLAKGTSIVVSSDFYGLYSINIPKDVNIMLFSYVGFETKEVSIFKTSFKFGRVSCYKFNNLKGKGRFAS